MHKKKRRRVMNLRFARTNNSHRFFFWGKPPRPKILTKLKPE